MASTSIDPWKVQASEDKQLGTDRSCRQEFKGPARRHIPALDGLRGVAILLVFMIHNGYLSNSPSLLASTLRHTKDAGWIGVDIFFTLSGFLITGILWDQRGTRHSWTEFYRRRALRLFPLFYGVWVCLALYIYMTHQQWHATYWAYLLYAGNYVQPLTPAVGNFAIGHFWSLAVEEQFYLVWPFLIWGVASAKRYIQIAIGGVVAAITLKVILFYLFQVDSHWTYVLTPTHIEGLLVGGMAAVAIRHDSAEYWRRAAKIILPISITTLLVLWIILHDTSYTNRVGQLFSFTLVGIVTASVILRTTVPGTFCEYVLTNRSLMFLGKYSYGFYVYHLLLRYPINHLLRDEFSHIFGNEGLSKMAYLISAFVIFLAISVVSYQVLERPFLRLKERKRL